MEILNICLVAFCDLSGVVFSINKSWDVFDFFETLTLNISSKFDFLLFRRLMILVTIYFEVRPLIFSILYTLNIFPLPILIGLQIVTYIFKHSLNLIGITKFL